jgi:O-antigen ligase
LHTAFLRETDLHSRPWWLWMAVCVPTASSLSNFLWPGEPLFRGHSIAVIVMVFGTAATFFAWLPFRTQFKWTGTALAVFTLILAAWLTLLIRLHLSHVGYDFGVFALPIFIILMVLKPTSLRDNEIAIRIAALAIVIAAFVTLAIEPFGITDSSFAAASGSQRIDLLRDYGFDYRWFGPFIHSNLAGPLGGAVLIVGLFSRGTTRLFLVIGGAIMLILSGSRTGVVPLILVMALIILLPSDRRSGLVWRVARWSLAVLALVTVVTYILRFDSTMSGRTYAWIDFGKLFLSSPWLGVDQSGVQEYIAANSTSGEVAQPHAHNVLLDIAGRWGIIPLVITATVFALSVLLGVQALKARHAMGAILTMYLLVVTLSETPFSWHSLNSFLTLFILSNAISSSASSSDSASLAYADNRKGLARFTN